MRFATAEGATGAGGDLQASSAGITVGSPAAWRWDRAKSLEVGEEVERVVGAGAVGAEPDRDAGLARGRVGEHAADRQLHVGDRVGDDGAAALGDQLQLGAVEPDAVGEDGALVEQAEPVEVGGGPHAVRGRGTPLTSCSVSERWICTGSSRSAASSAVQRSSPSLTV